MRLVAMLARLFHRNTALWQHQPASDQHFAAPTQFKEYGAAPNYKLPPPQRLATALGDLLTNRYSCRNFAAVDLDQQHLSDLLHASYGILGRVVLEDTELLVRPVPSGGALYPLELYLLVRSVAGVEPGIYHYAAIDHSLEQLSPDAVEAGQLRELFLHQYYAGDAALVVVITTVWERTFAKYGDRGYRLILFEAGHVAQNLNLAAAAVNWSSINLGGFYDNELSTLLGLNEEAEVPLYAIAIGVPAAMDNTQLRLLLSDQR